MNSEPMPIGLETDATVYQRLLQLRQSMSEHMLKDPVADVQQIQDCAQQWDLIYYDFSRQRVNAEVLKWLRTYARTRGLPQWLQRLVQGAVVNPSEQRPAQHLALRDLDGCLPDTVATWTAFEQRHHMFQVLQDLQLGKICGARGTPIDTLVHIGVGGSHLGAAMAVRAMHSFTSGCFELHFVSSLDGVALQALLPQLDLDYTLFVVSSKTFSTQDTMENARTCQQFMQQRGYAEVEIRRHFLGISASVQAMRNWGIAEDLQLEFMPGIGGRFSLASSIGFPLAACIGQEGFSEFLQGMHQVDLHVLQQEEQSIPASMALLDWWNLEFWHTEAVAVLPYHQDMELFPAYLMQLQMESLGKGYDVAGRLIAHSGMLLFGDVGTSAQHSFMQLLHQGTHNIQADFIIFADMPETNAHQRDCTLANALAQGLALAQGYSLEQAQQDFPNESVEQSLARVHLGNRPSATLLVSALTPKTLGMLVAIYEHRTMLLAALMGINPFDQMGVELGKRMAGSLLQPVITGDTANQDVTTAALVAAIHRLRRENH